MSPRTPDRCPLERKTTFLSRISAEEWCRWLERYGREDARGMHAYMCHHFPHWHIGHSRRPAEGVERASSVRMAEYGGSDPT